MSNKIEIIATPKTMEEIRPEFERFVKLATDNNWTELDVLFTAGWEFIYEEVKPTPKKIMTPQELLELLLEVESKNYGKLGDDDIFIKPIGTTIQLKFCHEADIHIEGPVDSEFIRDEKKRFESMGWDVYELEIINKNK